MNSKQYRLGVGIMLLNSDKQVWVGKRVDFKSAAWQMPQGGVDQGEDFEKAAFRELEEETGITEAKIIFSTHGFVTYDLPPELQNVLWGGRYLGQKQKWFLMTYDGDESEIDLKAHTQEFDEWKWVDPIELPNIIVPFKKKVYEDVLKEFLPAIKKL